jgi:hypothetical protein
MAGYGLRLLVDEDGEGVAPRSVKLPRSYILIEPLPNVFILDHD